LLCLSVAFVVPHAACTPCRLGGAAEQHAEVRHLRVADRALVAGAIVAPVGTPLGQVTSGQGCRVRAADSAAEGSGLQTGQGCRQGCTDLSDKVVDPPANHFNAKASSSFARSMRCVCNAQTGQVTAVQVAVDVRDGAGAVHYGVPSTRLARVRQQSPFWLSDCSFLMC
jgi:hypothetical protein